MEIRGMREAELEEMIALQCRVFRADGHERYTQYVRGDSSYQLDQTRVVMVDGRIAATLRVWDRQLRIGSTAMRTGGIGGVGTHPDCRGRGCASVMMAEVIGYLRESGYALGALFSEIPCRFYRRLGWASMPLSGFRVIPRERVELGAAGWQVEPFDEARDLKQVVALYQAHNARQSGSILRPRAHWDTKPARIRGLLPTMVARRGNVLGGYLNFEIEGKIADVLEVAYERSDPGALAALVDHLLGVCEERNVEELAGEIPHRHPLVDLLIEGSKGDLFLTGNTSPSISWYSMMLYAVNLPMLLRQVLPDLQERLDTSGRSFAPVSLGFAINQQECALQLDQAGTLQVVEDTPAEPVDLPAEFFWRLLFGESGWTQLEPALQARGILVKPEIGALLRVLFPLQEVIFWAPDHY